MFDIKWIRDNADAFDAALKRRGLEPLSAGLIKQDEALRAVKTRLQEALAKRNAVSKDIGKAKGAKDGALAEILMGEVATLKDVIAKGEDEERVKQAELDAALAVIPNLPREDVPVGQGRARQRGSAQGWYAAKVGLRAEAAFRNRRSAGHDGLRRGGENFRRPLCRDQGTACKA